MSFDHKRPESNKEGSTATTDSIQLLIQQAENIGHDHIESLAELSQRIGEESEKACYPKGKIESMLLMARYYALKDENVEAIQLATEALQMFEQSSDTVGQVKALSTLGFSHGQLGRLDAALQHFLDGLKLLDQSGTSGHDADAIRGNLLNNIASIHGDMGRYDEALEVLQDVLGHAEKTGGAPLVAALSNLSEANLKKGNLMNAMVYNQRALMETKTKNLGNMHLYLCLSNFGKIYEQSGQQDKAIASYSEALDTAMRMNNRFSMAGALVSIGALMLKSQAYGESVAALEQALSLAEEIQAGELRRTIHQLMMEAHEKSNDYMRAYTHLKKYVDIDKNLETHEMERKLSNYFADLRIDQARKDAEIHRLKNVELRQKSEEIEQKALELEQSYRNIKAISEIGQRITNTLEFELILVTIHDSVRQLMDAGLFAIGLYDEAMGIIDFRIVMMDARPRPLFQVSVDDSRSIASAVVRTGREMLLSDSDILFTENAAMITRDNHCKPPKSSMCCPLVLGDRITGVIVVQSCHPNAYAQQHLETIKALASFVAIALNNSRQSAELKAKARELELASRTDPLTGLYNRRHVLEKIEEERVRHKRSGRPFCVIIGDIDFFKKVNDVYGHDCGDAVLKALANLLGRHIRRQDCLSRWGGEEFLMLLPETAADGASVLAEKLRKRIEEYEFTYAGMKLPLTMTFGVAQYNDDYGVDACIVGADSALYKGKSNGRNCVVTF